MIWGYRISDIIYQDGQHFVMGFLVGLLAYYSMRIISSNTMQKEHPHGLFTGRRFGWLVVSLSIMAHVLEDYYIRWF